MSSKFVHPNQVSAICRTRGGAACTQERSAIHTHPSLQPGRVYSTQSPLPAASEGGKGPGKVTQSMTAPQGRISSPLALLTDVCVTCPQRPPVKGGHVLPPATSSSSLRGNSEDFPTLSELHCVPPSCREPLSSQLQLFSQTERVETIC